MTIKYIYIYKFRILVQGDVYMVLRSIYQGLEATLVYHQTDHYGIGEEYNIYLLG